MVLIQCYIITTIYLFKWNNWLYSFTMNQITFDTYCVHFYKHASTFFLPWPIGRGDSFKSYEENFRRTPFPTTNTSLTSYPSIYWYIMNTEIMQHPSTQEQDNYSSYNFTKLIGENNIQKYIHLRCPWQVR